MQDLMKHADRSDHSAGVATGTDAASVTKAATTDYLVFTQQTQWQDLPTSVQHMVRTCVLDLLGVAASGTQTELSRIIREHALEQFSSQSPRRARLLFDGRHVGAVGAALANGMTIDSVDAHDGYKPSKGHAGCSLLSGVLSLYDYHDQSASLQEFLLSIVIGYEIACRAGVALHSSVPDYHTSGAWGAVAVATIGSRILGLNAAQTREAAGIAEYHGPRSQMMRVIDHPTMLKDGSGWGAMAGVSAALLARDGFTGSPALTLEDIGVQNVWQDLGTRWLIEEQYFKPVPVCRWAQPAIVACRDLQIQNGFKASDIKRLTIGSFHESVRLEARAPQTTEEAQYSLPYPVAAMLVHGRLGVPEVNQPLLSNNEALTLSRAIELEEIDAYNALFPEKRISHVVIELHDGRVLESGPVEATGDPDKPLPAGTLEQKFMDYTSPITGDERALRIKELLLNGDITTVKLSDLAELIYPAA